MGGIATGIFGLRIFGGTGGVSFEAQLIGSLVLIVIALIGGVIVFKGVDLLVGGLRLTSNQELVGADIAMHRLSAYQEEDMVVSPNLKGKYFESLKDQLDDFAEKSPSLE